jgi:hypothetical protein
LKTCSKCGETKPLDAFHSQPSGVLGRHSYCAECANQKQREARSGVPRNPLDRRKHLLKQRYGLTPESYDELFASQDGKCAICREVPARPCVDHNHETGQVRGILCHHCNIRLPAVENVNYLTSALAYLASYKRPQEEAAA